MALFSVNFDLNMFEARQFLGFVTNFIKFDKITGVHIRDHIHKHQCFYA
jgi:hypothetical protein